MTKALTVKFVENVPPGPKRKEIPHGSFGGLYLVVQPSGVKSWAYRFKLNGSSKKLTLGRYPKISLANAKKLAEDTALKIGLGKDPAAHKATDSTFGYYLDEYFKGRESEGFAGDPEIRRAILFDCNDWLKLDLASITHGTIQRRLEAIKSRSKAKSAASARKVYAGLKGIFQLGVAHEVLDENPVKKLDCPTGLNERERCLDDDELVAVWKAAEAIGYPYGTIIRLLILTGARRDEIADAKAGWLDLHKGTLTIPKASMKTRAGPHVIYLTDLMRDVLAECRAPNLSPGTPGDRFLFTIRGRVPFGDWARSKRQLRSGSSRACERDKANP